jgi:hypothetical protein
MATCEMEHGYVREGVARKGPEKHRNNFDMSSSGIQIEILRGRDLPEKVVCGLEVLRQPNSEAERIERKFKRLRDDWKAKRGHQSSSIELAMHPAYLKIIGMGWDAVPLLLRELDNEPDMWFLALRSITEENPVTDDIRGNVAAMAKAWLVWGQEHGVEW